ncbi:thrombospondin type 3 repeat-containing protein [Aurantibacter crassamenti]|uniref:Calx-beta domain-containing protein n=1 Tax=Aurantibacter crassamenti TaxID=1837375 RepID=UPI001939EB5D|nr:Calx-beta domain-containing protein [Aurantibacter crassamenti]MBM1105433.1 thrombospondin type 3 repeat-containing protein [Aurantibacter crassamenti]
MKRKILLLFICLVSVFVSGQTTEIPNPIFEEYLENPANGINASDGIAGNGFVNTAAINNPAVTTLDLDNLEIDDFSGIEAFGFLEEFRINMGNTVLTSIDFSQNKNLKIIFIDGAPLANINVDGTDALEELTIQRGNQLTNLNVTNNLNLKFLAVYQNSISTIIVSNNSQLEFLALTDMPQLTNLSDLSVNSSLAGFVAINTGLERIELLGLTDLGTVTLEVANNSNLNYFEMTNSSVQSLILSTNTALETIKLDGNTSLTSFLLPPDNSPLTKFEIRDSSNFTNTFEIKDRTQLESIIIWNSGSDEIIIDNLPSLTSLIIDEHVNNLTKLKIKNNPQLTSFDFRNNLQFIDVEIEDNINLQVLDGLRRSTFNTVDRISLLGNDIINLNVDGFEDLEQLNVTGNDNLNILDLTKMSVDPLNPSKLRVFESTDTRIEELDFSNNPNMELISVSSPSNTGSLKRLSVKNGQNIILTEFNLFGNSQLTCVEVDAGTVGTSPTGWVKDSQTVYAESCISAAPVLVSFVVANEENLENNAVPTPQLVLVGTVSVATTISITDVTSSSASTNLAIAGIDYEFNSGSPLVIPIPAGTYDANNPLAVTDLDIFGDTDYEDNELIVLEASSNSTELVNAADNAPLSSGTLLYNYNILEDDYRIDISAGPSVAENGSNGSFTISLVDDNGNAVNNSSGGNIEVFFSNKGNALENTDFVFLGSTGNSSVIINNAQNSSILTVDLSDDNLFEDDEFIDLEITDGDGYYLDLNNGTPSAGFSILDNDDRISFSSTQVGLEGGNDVAFTIQLSDENGVAAINDTSIDIGFDIGFLPGTGADAALLGTDFIDGIKNDADKTVFIQNNQNSVTFEIEVINDTDLENQENFISAISVSPDTQVFALGFVVDNDQAVGLINDNDGAVQATTRIPDSNFETELERLGYGDGIPNNEKVLTASIETVQILVIQGLDIVDATGIEAFAALVSLEAEANGLTTIDVSNLVNLEILRLGSNQLNGIGLSSNPKLRVFEAANNNLQSVDFSNNPDLEDIYLFDNAIKNLDVSDIQNLALFTANGNPLECVKVDNVVEAQNLFDSGDWLTNSRDVFSENCNPVTSFVAEVEIITDILNTSNINEGLRDVEIQMSIPNADTDNLIVEFDIEVIGVTATSGEDFDNVPQNSQLTYEYSNDGQTVYNVGILDDNLLEGNEQLRIRISNPSDSRVTLKDADVNGVLEFLVTIVDNETANAELSALDGAEGGDARITVNLRDGTGVPILNNTGGDITFDFALANGTATSSADFVNLAPNTKLIISNGAAGAFIDVPLIDDTDEEPQENFTATISNPSLSLVTSTGASATVTIAASDSAAAANDNDGDGVLNDLDNCSDNPNANQADLDNDDIGDVCDDDIDGDGVLNIQDVCPIEAGSAENSGCPSQSNSEIGPEDIHVQVQNATCSGVSNGIIAVELFKDYNGMIKVSGASLAEPTILALNMNTVSVVENLAVGTYEVCVTLTEFPNFEQCYKLNVLTYEDLVVATQGVDLAGKSAVYEVEGSRSYKVTVNDKVFTHDFETTKTRLISVPLDAGMNKVHITGISDCQGIFTDEIVIGHITAYPNPVLDELHFEGILGSGNATVVVANVAGNVARKVITPISNAKIKVDFEGLSKGLYVIFLRTDKEVIEFKIIKK